MVDLIDDESPDFDALRSQAAMAERRRIGVAAAHQFLMSYRDTQRGQNRLGEMIAFGYVAVHICGIGTPFSSTGERDPSVDERAREFLELPELSFERDKPEHRFYSVTAGQQRCDRCQMGKTGGVTKVPPCGSEAICPVAQGREHTPKWHQIVTWAGTDLPDSCAYCKLAGEATEWLTISGPAE